MKQLLTKYQFFKKFIQILHIQKKKKKKKKIVIFKVQLELF